MARRTTQRAPRPTSRRCCCCCALLFIQTLQLRGAGGACCCCTHLSCTYVLLHSGFTCSLEFFCQLLRFFKTLCVKLCFFFQKLKKKPRGVCIIFLKANDSRFIYTQRRCASFFIFPQPRTEPLTLFPRLYSILVVLFSVQESNSGSLQKQGTSFFTL